MASELEAILGIAPLEAKSAPAVPKVVRQAPRMDPLDALVRTVYGEAGTPAERPWIAGVIANRARLSGKDYTDVVLEDGQFEPWNNPTARARMEKLTPDHPDYQAILADIREVLDGKDPTGGATHFYAPDAQAKLGRPKPAWDDGTGTQIGQTKFFKGDYGGAKGGGGAELASLLGANITPEAEEAFNKAFGAAGDGTVVDAKTGEALNAQQTAFYARMNREGKIDPKAPGGSEYLPFAQREKGDIPQQPGAYYVDLEGNLQRTPVADKDQWMADAQLAKKLGDTERAQQIIAEHVGSMGEAQRGAILSGLLLGGKNEIGSAIKSIPALFTGGADGYTGAFGKNLSAADARDAELHKLHPMATDASRVIGSLATGGAVTAATGGQGLPLLTRMGIQGGTGATVGGTQGFLGTDGSLEDRLKAGGTGAVFGGLLGPGAEMAGATGAGVARRLTGGGVNPEVADLARSAIDRFGIRIRPGQISSSPAVKFLDSVLSRTGGTGYAAKDADARTAFTRAVASTIGENTDNLTQRTMAQARRRIGAEFDAVAARSTINDVDSLQTAISQAITDAQGVLPENEIAPLLTQAERVADVVTRDASGARQITGESYQALTRKGAPLERLQRSSNPNVSYYADQIRSALDDALEASAPAEVLEQLRTARRQWKNLKTIEPLAGKAGAAGEISPALLRERVRQSYGDYSYSGAGDLGELAEIGQQFLKEPPSSGTAERQAAQRLMGMLGIGGFAGGAALPFTDLETAGKVAVTVGALGLGSTVASRIAAEGLDNPLYLRMLLGRAAQQQASRTPLVNGPNTALLANRFLAPQPQPAPGQ